MFLIVIYSLGVVTIPVQNIRPKLAPFALPNIDITTFYSHTTSALTKLRLFNHNSSSLYEHKPRASYVIHNTKFSAHVTADKGDALIKF